MKVGLLTAFLAIFMSSCPLGYGYRILGVFPFNSKSHFTVFEGLMKSLADRGHRVDIVSSFPQGHLYDNYHDVVELPETSPSTINNVTYDEIRSKMGSVLDMVKTERGNGICKSLGDKNLLKFVKNPPTDVPYDAVITEMLVANCYMVIGHILKVPVIGVSTYGRLPWVYDILGNPEQTDLVPKVSLGHHQTGFFQRLTTFLKSSHDKISFYKNTVEQDVILKKHFGKHAPTIRELESNVALALTNAHFTTHGAMAIVPGLIEVGGMHLVENRVDPLFTDIADFLDTSQHGAIYVNLGEELLFETLPEHIIKAFWEVFTKIQPIRVLLRVRDFESLPPGIPPNVVTLPWVQQLRVLQHQNVRVFITHGGLLGMQEAIYSATPIVGIPLWGDQFENVDIAVRNNLGVRLDLHSITAESLGLALNNTLKNSTFIQAARVMSEKFVERPEAPIDTACYWVEYVIKHGSNSVRATMMNLSWFATSYVDVYIFVALIIFAFVYFIYRAARYAILSVFSRFRRNPKSTKLL